MGFEGAESAESAERLMPDAAGRLKILSLGYAKSYGRSDGLGGGSRLSACFDMCQGAPILGMAANGRVSGLLPVLEKASQLWGRTKTAHMVEGAD